MELLLTELHREAMLRECTISLLALAKLAAASKAPHERHRRGWRNAFSVADEHRWEVTQLETEAFATVGRH